MSSKSISAALIAASLIASSGFAATSSGSVPAPFRGHDESSVFTIQYADVDAVLRTMVVDVGRSTREVDDPVRPKTGTRMKAKVSRTTSKEANRFYFEEFEKNPDFKQVLHLVRLSLEAIPGRMPLETFSRKEQLAYWLNLYNITLLDELVQIYPERNLKKEIDGRKSILAKKVLNVAGVPLSLNDIQYTILATNYDNNPLIMYGLYQGIIGGPNIRKVAYTAENVYRLLQDNAEEFVNSNRGTYTRNGRFEVSSLYERNSQYFPNFDEDLKQHLMRFIEGPERQQLEQAGSLRADIDDWTIADVYGTFTEIGGSFATSNAALQDAVVSVQEGTLGATPTNFSVASSMVMSKAPQLAEFSPEVLAHLNAIKEREEAANLMREGRVTIEEMGTVPTGSDQPEDDSEGEDEK